MIALLSMASLAHAQYQPPDRYGDAHQGSDVVRRNDGQKFGTDGHPRTDIKAFFEGSPVDISLRDSSRVSFSYAVIHYDSITPDTTCRVDMAIGATKLENPQLVADAPGVSNYYRGSSAVEQVPAFYRGIYADVIDHIDYDLYGTTGGPRMAFVVRPGGDPHNIKPAFTGRDSLGIDWQGALKVYMQHKWIKLEQAVAYQVDTNGSMTDVGWNATYVLDQGNAFVHFNFGTYDPDLPLVLQIGYGPMQLGGGINDRNLDWCTYMGGTGGDAFTSVETDDEGNPYTCGRTWSNDFPVAPGNQQFNPFQPNALGYDNAVVMKFDGNNKQLVWATYYGGSTVSTSGVDARTEAHKLAVEPSSLSTLQCAFVTGTTNCTDFATWAASSTPFANALQEAFLGGRQRMWIGAFRKYNGIRYWATTHGEMDTYTTEEEGLAIDYTSYGGLAVGGRLYRHYGYAPNFQSVTPNGAYQQASGGGFVMLFNPDFTIRWSSPFTEQFTYLPYSQVTDVRFSQGSNTTNLWFTGNTSTSFQPATAPNNGYHGFGGAFLANLDLATLQLDYFTQWGNDQRAIGYALDFEGKQIWMVGGTVAQNLTDVECPDPGGAGVYHTHVNSGNGNPHEWSDGFILMFDAEHFTLNYGTLFGGGNYDMLTDIGHDNERMYITGETRSSTGSSIVQDIAPQRYHQDLNPNITSRDALVLAIDHASSTPALVWSTAFGGTRSDRGWGIAASHSEVYLVGATASSSWEEFPLREFDPVGPNDFYQDYNFGGIGYNFLEFYGFDGSLDLTGFIEVSPEDLNQPHDGFIASFSAPLQVGIHEHPGQDTELRVTPLPALDQWNVQLPEGDNWTLTAYTAAGQILARWKVQGNNFTVDLHERAAGMYLLRAATPSGQVASAKVVRP